MIDLLLELLSFPSPQPEMDRVRCFVAEVVRPKLGETRWDDVVIDGAGNLVARLDGPEPLLLLTYAATYPAANMSEPYPARRLPGGWIRGRGASEQRSGLAAALWAANEYVAQPRTPGRGLIFATCVAGEMGSHDVVEALLDGLPVRPWAGLIAVNTGNGVCLGNKGRVDVHVDVHGRSCHSADPGSGLNAVEGAVAYLQRLPPSPPDDPELGEATLTVTAIQSEPRTPHTVPGLCRLTFDRRLLPGEDPGQVVARFRRDLSPWRLVVEQGRVNLPNKVPGEHPVAAALLAAAEEAGVNPRPWYRKSALDAGVLTARGSPAVMFGPGEQRFAHTDDERVAEADVLAAARVYGAFLRRVCSG